jgi:hypothetical protein
MDRSYALHVLPEGGPDVVQRAFICLDFAVVNDIDLEEAQLDSLRFSNRFPFVHGCLRLMEWRNREAACSI